MLFIITVTFSLVFAFLAVVYNIHPEWDESIIKGNFLKRILIIVILLGLVYLLLKVDSAVSLLLAIVVAIGLIVAGINLLTDVFLWLVSRFASLKEFKFSMAFMFISEFIFLSPTVVTNKEYVPYILFVCAAQIATIAFLLVRIAVMNTGKIHNESVIDKMKFIITGFTLWILAFGNLTENIRIIDPEAFVGINSYGDSLYYALITMATIGYGDMYPANWRGKLVASSISLGSMFFLIVFISTYMTNVRGKDE